ncbi:hypothetical protein GCK72_024566 [Caenorhabditis remanei]|uniref:Uncharacterized protein n=1 Tax=Caenorhabditis remanei TaxID=31234 RepID=E3LDK3_CAERE|nr:hypothetical protein GCK72_024566 [Caenorhabditis remanei]EFO82244.1 hypothetical protein CRE_00176 [Caenorhabditis remanei]KAF1748099.1 hypothetical protein GCK72_024566 [Caenorhabditis remanei]
MKEVQSILSLENITLADSESFNNLDENTAKNASPERSILRELIDLPTVNTGLLKSIHQFLAAGGFSDERISEFLEHWNQTYYDVKKPLFDNFVETVFDREDTTTFDSFINTENNELNGRRKMLQDVHHYHAEYQRSNNLSNSSLEKMIALLIATDYIQPNFFLFFNFACEQPDTTLKTHLLNSIFNLNLVGYDEENDKRLALRLINNP